MSDTDPDSSFEVVEEEVISSFPDDSIETLGHDQFAETQWNACECKPTKSHDQPETYSFPETSEQSEQSWNEPPNTSLTALDSTLTDNALVLRGPLKVEHGKALHRRTRKRSNRQISLSDTLPTSQPSVTPSLNGKLLFAVIGLFGLSLALLYTTIRQAQLISQLQQEAVSLRSLHEQELREEFEKYATQDAKSRALILDLQKERHKLLNELQTQIERQANRDTERRDTILELRTERRKLMDSTSESPKRACKNLKTRNELLEKQLQTTRDELNDVKEVLIELRKNSLCIPGMKFFNWILCKGFRLCPEDFQ